MKETIRIAVSALADANGFAFLAGVLPRRKPDAARQRVVDEHYFDKLAQ